ncbi:MAG TPA: LPS assembly protein LptD [Syntrophorhabdus sp.]|jgi:LPS-assembly protein|nr:LPS assembly protein LptD [Syntrophorhabdus sp.]
MIFSKKALIFLIIVWLFMPVFASGKNSAISLPKFTITTEPVEISANSLEYDKINNVYKAKGAVDLQEGTRRLMADEVVYNMDSGDIAASGNIVFQDGEDIIKCERLSLNLETKTGTIEKGTIYIKQNNFTVTGEQIEKVGDQQYKIKKGQFTTCDMPQPDWKFSARDVDITVEGYAKTKGTRFHILDQPVLYLPYGLFPVLTKRQSGFLMPDLTVSSRDGIKIKNSYFWAIDRDKDATIGLEYIEKRGFKPELEYRYDLKEGLKGAWNFAIIDDTKYDHWRYEIKGKHEQTLFKDLRLKTNIDYVSDYAYLMDYRQGLDERSENHLKSTAYLEKPFSHSLLTVEGAYFRDLSRKDNDNTFKFYPHATFFTDYLPLIRRVLYADISAEASNFYREEGNTYSRISIEPRLRLPFSWNGVNFLLSGTLFEKFYYIDESKPKDTSTKNLGTARFDGSTNVQFMRNYNVDLWNIGTVQSVIRPQVQYTFISNNSYREIPLIDPFDRIGKTNTITYSLSHYLNTFTPQVGGKEISLLEVFQTYGMSGNLPLSDAYRGYGNRFSDITGRLTLFMKKNISFTNEAALNVHGEGITATRNVLRYIYPEVYYMNISHNYTQSLANQMDLDIGGKYKFLTGRYRIIYSFKNKEWIDTQYQLIYQPQCWAVILTLKQTKRPNDTSINIGFDLTGLTGKIDDINKTFGIYQR